jgi:small subunit ribosomal protein S5
MSDELNTINKEVKTESVVSVESTAVSTAPVVPAAPSATKTAGKDFNPINQQRGSGDFKKNRRVSKRSPRQKSEFDQKIIDIRRVTRVSSGGRRFSFSVAIVVGNRKGKIGVGTGKAGDTSLAIDKATKDAQKNAILINTTKLMSIPHEVSAKFNSARVKILPAPKRGVVAGSAMRDIIELGGLNDLNGKILSGSKNKLNIAKATIKALSSLSKTVIKEKTVVENKAVKSEMLNK